VADIFEDHLGWRVSSDDVRGWMRRLSREQGRYRLVLLVDDLDTSRGEILKDVEDIMSQGFGPSVVVVATVTPKAAEQLRYAQTGASRSKLGRLEQRGYRPAAEEPGRRWGVGH
jgi:hypothetical protein